MEIPYAGRAIITENFDGFEIIIPSKKNWFLIPFLGVWLCMWCLGEFFALSTLILGKTGIAPGLFMLVWLSGWTVGGFFAFRAFFWNLMGKEVISISHGELKIDKQ